MGFINIGNYDIVGLYLVWMWLLCCIIFGMDVVGLFMYYFLCILYYIIGVNSLVCLLF